MLMVYSWLVTIRDLMCIVAIIMWDSPNAINNYHLGMVYEFLMIFLGWFMALALPDCCHLLQYQNLWSCLLLWKPKQVKVDDFPIKDW